MRAAAPTEVETVAGRDVPSSRSYADFGHAFVVTIMLLTGNIRDGEGRLVCYPGQPLKPRRD